MKKKTWDNPLHLAINMNLHHLCGGNVLSKVSMWNSTWVSVRSSAVKFTMASLCASKAIQMVSKDSITTCRSSFTLFQSLVSIPSKCQVPIVQSKYNSLLPTQFKQKRILHSSIGYFYNDCHYILWHCSLSHIQLLNSKNPSPCL